MHGARHCQSAPREGDGSVSPPAWPERPDNAQDFDEFWLVKGLPPQPFPDDSYDYGSDPRFGPAGTRWSFPTERLIDRESVTGTSALTKAAIERLVKKLAIKLPPVGSMGWVTPLPEAPAADPVGEPMRWIHATIIGAIGTDEQVAHTLNFRTKPAPDVDQSPANLLTFGAQIRDAWVEFLGHQVTQGKPISSELASSLTYTEVRTAYVEQTQPATISTHQSRKTGRPVKDFAYPHAAYIVPTQYTPFADGVKGTGIEPLLPYEVACAISLGTGLRGPRNRGRLYLGPFSSSMMQAGGNGNFEPGKCAAIRDAFAAFVTRLNTNTGNQLHIVSRAYATSVPVTTVKVGVVPDSQRRRRRSRPEASAFGPATV
jgi:hypothetical protein